MTLLTVLTIVLVLLLVAILVVGLLRIIGLLEAIGGGQISYMGENMGDRMSGLAKIRWGLRAIERQTGSIGPSTQQVDGVLERMDGGLAEVEEGMDALLSHLEAQGAGR